MVKQHPVVMPGRRLQMRRRKVPALGPLAEADSASGRVHIRPTKLRILDTDQEPLGIHLAGEALGPLPAHRITVACPPPRSALALLLAAQILDIAPLSTSY